MDREKKTRRIPFIEVAKRSVLWISYLKSIITEIDKWIELEREIVAAERKAAKDRQKFNEAAADLEKAFRKKGGKER